MQLSSPSRTVALKSAPLPSVPADLLLVPFFEGESAGDIAGLDSASGGLVARALESREFTGRLYETYVTAADGWKAARVMLVGAGKRQEFTGERARRCATAGAAAARQKRAERIAWAIRGDLNLSACVQASVEGILRVTEGYHALGDTQMVGLGIRVAERLAARDPEAQADIRTFRARLGDSIPVGELR